MQQFNEVAKANFNRIITVKTDTADSSKIKLSEEQLRLQTVEDVYEGLTNRPERISIGIDCIDDIFGEYVNGEYVKGFRRKDIIILAGMSNVGKTTVAFSMFTNLFKRNIPTVFFSLDMRKEKTWDCFRKCMCGLNRTDAEFVEELILRKKLPQIVTHTGDITMQQLIKFVENNPAEVIFIDYIDYLQPTEKGGTDAQKFKNLFIELKQFVEKYNCTVIILSQSTEDNTYRQGRPTISNLYGGKAVRSAVDHIIAVYRNSKHNEKLPPEYKSVTEIKVLKARSDSGIDTAYIKYRNGNMVNMDIDEIDKYKFTLTSK